MQAIIMAAGKGSRLGKLTGGKPKSFAEIRGKRLIDYNLRLLEMHGVDEIIIVTGYQCGAFEELAAGRNDIRLVFNPFYEMANVLGSFYMGMDFLHDDFIYLHADTICDPQIFGRLASMGTDVTLPVDFKPCDGEAMKVRIESGKIVQITKDMPSVMADGEFIGLASFRKNTIPALKEKTVQLLKEKAFSSYFEAAVQRLIEEEKFDIKAIPTDGAFWIEVDFVEDYEKAVRDMPQSLIEIFA